MSALAHAGHLFSNILRHPTLIFRAGLVIAALPAIVCTAAVAAAQPARQVEDAREFNIPAGDAATTLRQLSAQAGVELLYSTEAVAGVQTRTVRGRLSPLEALAQLLRDTPLQAQRHPVTGGYAIIRPKGTDRRPTAPPPRPRDNAASDNAQPSPESKKPMKPTKSSGLLSLLAGWFALAPVDGDAQTANAAKGPTRDEVVTLSPFEVNTARDTGYAATETLAGTRMRTNLRDVGASLTVITPEFMRDLGVNSFDQALLYTPSVDATEGDNTDASRAGGTQMRFGTGQSYSIRGFNTNAGNQSISHDFFTALEPTDNYNLERVTLSLGPNALLVGVGNPQGTAVTSTKRAQLLRRKTEVQLQADTHSSRRLSVDHNQPLIKDKLAFRINLLHDETREFRRYEGKKQERLTLSVSAKPWAKTKLTLNHESYSLGTNASSLVWGFDGSVLRWAAAGKPTIQFLPAGQTWTTTRPYVDASGNRVLVAAGVVDADGFVDSRNDFDPNLVLSQIAANTQVYTVGLNLPNPMINTRYQGQLSSAMFGGAANANYQSKNPWATLGLSKSTNLNGGTWDDPTSAQHGRWSQLLLEQKLADGLYLELGGNLALYKQSLAPNFFNTVTIDPNRYLPDGSPNPGYLVPYAENNQMQLRLVKNRSAEYRATLSYELDLTRRHRWLGKHNVAGLGQTSRSDASQDITRAYNLATVGLPAAGGWSETTINGANALLTRVYFVDGNVPGLPDAVHVLNSLARLNSYGKLLGATPNEAAPLNLNQISFLNPAKSKFTSNAVSLGWQARWFGDRLVTVVGHRQDDTKSYGVPTVQNVTNPAIPGSATDPRKQTFALAQDVPYDDGPLIVAHGKSRTYGGVYHALQWLSLTYSRSSNFLPSPNSSWFDMLGRPAPNSRGETEDYGLRLSLLQGRLAIGINRFKTSADNQSRNAASWVSGARAVVARLRANYKVPGDSHFTDMAEAGGYPIDLNVSDTWSYVAEGYEMNLIYNPSRNWRISLSGSSNINKLGTHLGALGTYLYTESKFQGLGTWRKFANELHKVESGQASAFFDLNPTSATARAQAAADALYLEQQTAAQEKSYLDDIALTGVTYARSGKYAMNGLVTRVFNEGRLKGWSVGGNFRWRSKNVVGYERRPDAAGQPTGTIDKDRPLNGEDFWDLGAMVSYQRRVFGSVNLRTQLNIQNLPNWQSPRLVRSDTDTNGIYGNTHAVVPVLWELRRPRKYVLTATFEF